VLGRGVRGVRGERETGGERELGAAGGRGVSGNGVTLRFGGRVGVVGAVRARGFGNMVDGDKDG
jgi:hypothetical protein